MILSYSKEFPWGKPTWFPEKILAGTKIHTIREDKHHRWREGMKIHHATGMRTPDYNCFKEEQCTGVQEIEIIRGSSPVGESLSIYVDGFMIPEETAIELARNDGFETLEDFGRWFDETFVGRLIHWTDERY